MTSDARSLSRPIIAALLVGGMAATTNTSVTGLLLTSIADDLGHSVALLGGLKSISAVVAFITAFPLSRVADRYPRKYLIALGLGCMLTAALFALTAANLTWFIGYYLFAGAADVILFAMLLAAASDYIDGAAMDRASGFVIGAFGLSGFVIVPLAGVISDSHGWRQAYLINIGVALAGMLLVLLLLPKVPPTGSTSASTLSHLRMLTRKPGLTMILLGNIMRFTMLTVLIVYVAAFIIERFELSDGRAGFYFGIGSAMFLVSAFASGLLIARLGLRRLMLPGGLIVAGGLFLAFLPGVPGLLTGASFLVSGSLLSIQENGALGVILRVAPRDRGAATSLNEIGAAIAGIFGSAVGGLIVGQFGYGGLGVFLAVTGLAAFVFTRLSFLKAVPVR
ncbi:MFS transporter [soil metagenome]